jgi:hypothetical protein
LTRVCEDKVWTKYCCNVCEVGFKEESLLEIRMKEKAEEKAERKKPKEKAEKPKNLKFEPEIESPDSLGLIEMEKEVMEHTLVQAPKLIQPPVPKSVQPSVPVSSPTPVSALVPVPALIAPKPVQSIPTPVPTLLPPPAPTPEPVLKPVPFRTLAPGSLCSLSSLYGGLPSKNTGSSKE